MQDGGSGVGRRRGAGGDGEGVGEGGLLIEGEGGGVDGGEMVERRRGRRSRRSRRCGLVVLVEGEEDLGGEVALVGVELLHLGASEALGGGEATSPGWSWRL